MRTDSMTARMSKATAAVRSPLLQRRQSRLHSSQKVRLNDRSLIFFSYSRKLEPCAGPDTGQIRESSKMTPRLGHDYALGKSR